MLSRTISDQYHGDPTLVTLASAALDRPELRAFLKNASFDPASTAHLPASAYAWESERRFPIHTPEDTAASLVYRSKLASVPAEVDAKLAEAREAYGLSETLFAAATVKVASAEVEYAVPSQRRLPLGTPTQVKVAQEVLLRDKRLLDLETSVEAFCRLEKAATAHGVELDPVVATYAAKTACDGSFLKDALEERLCASKYPEHRDAYEKLAAAVPREYLTDTRLLVKLASRIHELDKEAGLERWYDRRLLDPMQSVFNARTKTAAAGGGVSMDTLMQLPAQVWEQCDVPEMAELAAAGDVQAFEQAYNTLPLDIRMVLERQIR